MNAARPARAVHTLAWFGWTGAPLAWAALHVFGYSVTEAACGPPATIQPHASLSIDALAWAAMLAGVAVAVAALVSALTAFRATRGAEGLPGERVHFMAVVGLVISPLFLAIILMDGIGVIVLESCRQS